MAKKSKKKTTLGETFIKIYSSFLECKEVVDLLNTSQGLGMTALVFLENLCFKTTQTDGILYKNDDEGNLINLTADDIKYWFPYNQQFSDIKTINTLIKLLMMYNLLYENEFGKLTITNFCYTDNKEPSLHSVKDVTKKPRVFGVWEKKSPSEYRKKYSKMLELSGQDNPLMITYDTKKYINQEKLAKKLDVSHQTIGRWIKKFQIDYPNAIKMTDRKSILFNIEFLGDFKEMFKENLQKTKNKKSKNNDGRIVDENCGRIVDESEINSSIKKKLQKKA